MSFLFIGLADDVLAGDRLGLVHEKIPVCERGDQKHHEV